MQQIYKTSFTQEEPKQCMQDTGHPHLSLIKKKKKKNTADTLPF